MSAQMIAMQRAEALLKASGVQYAIQLQDGTVLGGLEIAPPRTHRRHVKVNNFVRDYDYITTMKALAPGGLTSWKLETRDKAVALQKTVSATAMRMWGRDNFITTVNDGTLEVLRVS